MLLSLHIPSPYPKDMRAAWPPFAQDSRTAYGYTRERLRAAQVSDIEISLMDKILPLTGLISDVTTRRIVNARTLITPLSNRYLYSWSRLAKLLRTDRRLVARRYTRGLEEIVRRLSPDKVDAIRHLFTNL